MDLVDQLKRGLSELSSGFSANVKPAGRSEVMGKSSLVDAAMGTLFSPNVGNMTVGSSENGFSGGVAGSAVGSLISDFRSHSIMQVDSWVNEGENEPITAEEVEKAIGADQLAAIAARTGLSSHAAAAGLARMLPDIIHKLTPGGQIPDDQMLYRAMGHAPITK